MDAWSRRAGGSRMAVWRVGGMVAGEGVSGWLTHEGCNTPSPRCACMEERRALGGKKGRKVFKKSRHHGFISYSINDTPETSPSP